MFPSLPMMPEPTTVSWLLVTLTMTASFIGRYLHFKIGARALAILAFGVLLVPIKAHAFGLVPGACGTGCMAQRNYWGTSIGYPGVYYYPNFYYPNYTTMPFNMLSPMGGYCWNCSYGAASPMSSRWYY